MSKLAAVLVLSYCITCYRGARIGHHKKQSPLIPVFGAAGLVLRPRLNRH